MIIKGNTIKMLTISAMLLLLALNWPAYSQEADNVLRGDKVFETMQAKKVTPQNAYDEIIRLESDLNNNFKVVNKPELLMEMAKYKTYLGYYSKDVNYVKKHLDEYTYFEPAGAYYYKGGDLKTIMDKYPDSKLADKAAFMLATMPQKAECEGDVYCYINVKLNQYKTFMVDYPQSPLQAEAIKDINNAIKPLTRDDCYNMVSDLSKIQKSEYLRLLDEYFLMLQEVKNKEKPAALDYLARAYNNFDRKELVQKIVDDIVKNYPDYQDLKALQDLITPAETKEPAKD